MDRQWPVEIVVFMRSVKSRGLLEQMKGRGVRVIKDDDLRGVNPGEHAHHDYLVIVDCVVVCEGYKSWVMLRKRESAAPAPACRAVLP